MVLNSTEEIIDDLRRGRMVVIMDDEDRENEGDLVIGTVLPQTGGLSVIIDALSQAIDMAVAEAGDAGNTNIRLIPTDSAAW